MQNGPALVKQRHNDALQIGIFMMWPMYRSRNASYLYVCFSVRLSPTVFELQNKKRTKPKPV